MRTAADELEFFTTVHALFRTSIASQNNQMVFASGKTKGKMILKKQDWPLSPVVISPSQINSVRSFAVLKERNCIGYG
jgi:hypothetical protein